MNRQNHVYQHPSHSLPERLELSILISLIKQIDNDKIQELVFDYERNLKKLSKAETIFLFELRSHSNHVRASMNHISVFMRMSFGSHLPKLHSQLYQYHRIIIEVDLNMVEFAISGQALH